MMPLGMNACDRCARKGLQCEQIKIDQKYKGPKRARQIKAVRSSNSTAQPEAKRSRLGTVVDTLCSVASKSAAILTAGAGKLHGILHDKIRFGSDRCIGALWTATAMVLKRRRLAEGEQFHHSQKHKKNFSEMLKHSDETCGSTYAIPLNQFLQTTKGTPDSYRGFFTQLQGHAGDILCKRAHDALECICLQKQMSVEQFHHSQWWIPAHIPQLNGPDPVYVTAVVLGQVSKHSNLAWDQLFRNSTELEDLLKSSEDALKSPLCKVGLFPLIGVFTSVEDEKIVADQYFWHCGTNWKGIEENVHNSEMDHCYSHLEFSASCRDKHDNELDCAVRIVVCAQASGALMSRTIRIIPKPPQLRRNNRGNMQEQQQPKVQCAQITFTNPPISVQSD